ncbi:MAG: hypothetical protein JWO85_2640 [Candidatus Eremiobacteraeota bacterium]|nr:hypothetical protein [Candidatus Eremiobacteraeota bacterium]
MRTRTEPASEARQPCGAIGQLDLFAAASVTRARQGRERALDAVEAANAAYLDTLRGLATEIARREGTVSIDDLRDEMPVRNVPLPSEVGIDNRVLGAVFRSAAFVAIGQQPTRRAERLARSGAGASHVTTYRLRGVA